MYRFVEHRRYLDALLDALNVHAVAVEYADWLGTSNVPKLFLKVEPGAFLATDRLFNIVRGWPALTEKTVP